MSCTTVSQATTPLAVDRHADDPAGVRFGFFEAIEHKVAEAVDDRAALVDVGPLRDVGVRSDDGRRARIDHGAGKLLLAIAGLGLILPAPVHEWDHHIGLVNFARGPEIGQDVIVHAPRNAWGPVPPRRIRSG